MENDILLKKYQKKLSIYFALFVLFSLWMTQGAFVISNYISHNLQTIDKLDAKASGLKNILANRESYGQKLYEDDTVLRTVIGKTLQGVTIYEDDQKIVGNLSSDALREQDQIVYSRENIYYQERVSLGTHRYHIIIQAVNEYSYYGLMQEMFFFVLFSLPFSILFYFLGQLFVGKNLKPIYETVNSLEDFSMNLNHEIKTPLTEIISTLSLTKRTGDNYDAAINQSLRSAHKIAKILDSMQGIIHLIDASYKKEWINLKEVTLAITKEHEPLCEQKGISVHTSFSEDASLIKTNRAHVEICIGNIIKNAIKYSTQESIINISLKKGILIIEDRGIGIDEENLKHIFDRYFRENYTKEEGYGLGLSLVKKIVDINGWDIHIESKKGSGTTVTLLFSKAHS